MPYQHKAVKTDHWSRLHSNSTPSEIKVLYVEDDIASQVLIEKAFTLRSSWQLLSASSIEEGIAKLQHRPDVLLLDINLPDGRGYELMSYLKATPEFSHIPVIAITACALRQQVEEGMNAGFFQYMIKPVDMNHLFHAIEVAVV